MTIYLVVQNTVTDGRRVIKACYEYEQADDFVKTNEACIEQFAKYLGISRDGLSLSIQEIELTHE